MAFECHKTREVGLSNNSVYPVGKACGEQVGVDQITSRIDKNILAFDSEIEIGGSENLKPSLECHPKKGNLTLCSSASLLPGNEPFSSYSRSITDLPPALISEILNRLDPKELGIVSCVSTSLYGLASEHHVWKEFYCERWGQPTAPTPPLGLGCSDEKTWRELFVEREFRSKTFLGRYSIDVLRGHTEAVRTVSILVSRKLIFTSGYDSIVRMWDMSEGFAIASSRPLGCTIRAIVADTKLMIAGGTDGFIHGWRAQEGLTYLFDLKGPQNQNTEFRLLEHEGPVSCLALDLTRIYSGSWDMTVLIWDRSLLKCLKVLRHSDWVWSVVPHDTTVASSAGSDVYVWDSNTGSLVAIVNDAHVGSIYSLARSHTGKLLFTGGEDGAIHMFEVINHSNEQKLLQVATWIPHSGPVNSLAFEFPWLVSASSDGKLSLIDVRKLLRTSIRSAIGSPKAKRVSMVSHVCQKNVEPPQRMLHGFGSNLYSVAIGSDRVVCGGEEGVIRIWNFSQALEIEQRVRALRGMRLENRMRRRKTQTEMNGKAGRAAEQCLVAAKKNPVNGDRNGVWHNKRGVSGKLKA